MFSTRRARQHNPNPVHALVLTFNRTLAGYVRSLAEQQISEEFDVNLEIETFGRWAMLHLGYPDIGDADGKKQILALARDIDGLTPDYIVNEVEYLLGRFTPDNLEEYLTTERTGRGALPRVGRRMRQRILSEIVEPYQTWLEENGIRDWNGLAIEMLRELDPIGYDIVIVDESQDFSAHQLRAIRHHLAEEHSATFVIDTVQRIYARGFTWNEAGYTVQAARSHMLRRNHRNTREIATFAAGILDGIGVEGDGALPNLEDAERSGPRPIVLRGLYRKQAKWAIKYIMKNVNLEEESVAFLKPQGGGWFSELARRLRGKGISFVDITRESEWPEGPVNVALSTFYSAKGLEFDYVFILGLNAENTAFDDEESDDKVFVLRRLLAVAVARARKVVVLGYKPGEESRLVAFFKPETYREKNV